MSQRAHKTINHVVMKGEPGSDDVLFDLSDPMKLVELSKMMTGGHRREFKGILKSAHASPPDDGFKSNVDFHDLLHNWNMGQIDHVLMRPAGGSDTQSFNLNDAAAFAKLTVEIGVNDGRMFKGIRMGDDNSSSPLEPQKKMPRVAVKVEGAVGTGKGQFVSKVDDSIDDILGCFDAGAGDQAIEEIMKSPKKQVTTTGVSYDVSDLFPVGESLWCVVYMGSPIWWLKPGAYHRMFNLYGTNKGLKQLPLFMESLREIHVRETPYGENKYRSVKRRGANRTTDSIVFNFKISKTEKHLFQIKLSKALDTIHALLRKRHKIGQHCFTYLKQDVPNILNWFRDRDGINTDQDIWERMDDEVEGTYSAARNITYGMKLDKYLMDHDIKLFLLNAGARNFDDVKNDLDKVYKNYPSKHLPNWNEMTQPSYTSLNP